MPLGSQRIRAGWLRASLAVRAGADRSGIDEEATGSGCCPIPYGCSPSFPWDSRGGCRSGMSSAGNRSRWTSLPALWAHRGDTLPDRPVGCRDSGEQAVCWVRLPQYPHLLPVPSSVSSPQVFAVARPDRRVVGEFTQSMPIVRANVREATVMRRCRIRAEVRGSGLPCGCRVPPVWARFRYSVPT